MIKVKRNNSLELDHPLHLIIYPATVFDYLMHGSVWLLINLALYGVFVNVIIIVMRRSGLTRTLLQKYENDENHRSSNHPHWYKVITENLSTKLKDKFFQLYQDDGTNDFLQNCYDKSDHLMWQLYHSVAVPFLKIFMTQTDVNGYLGRGSMFVFSEKQFSELIGDKIPDNSVLLDLGAGDGKVTDVMAAHFSQVFVTEISNQMQWRLKEKNYTLLGIDSWQTENSYDVVSCLNLLDRCDKPMTLIREVRSALKNDGRFIIASVYPYSPYVENSENNNKPVEKLNIPGKTLEEQIAGWVVNVFEPSGFALESFTRVPYLCEGDLQTSFYVLHDIVFVLRPIQ